MNQPMLSDEVRLRHMLDAAKEALVFADGKTREDIDADRSFALSLWKLLEVVCEASTHVTKITQDHYTNIPWTVLRGMRNRLIHAYFDVDWDIVWNTISENLPALVLELEQALTHFDKGTP